MPTCRPLLLPALGLVAAASGAAQTDLLQNRAEMAAMTPFPHALDAGPSVREMLADGGRRRTARRRRGRFHIGITRGEFEHDTENTPSVSDETDAGHFRLSVEHVGRRIGGGFRFDAIGTDDDLFEENGSILAEAGEGELYMHMTAELGGGPVEVPLRAGFFVRNYRLDDRTNNIDTDWFTVGFRTEIEVDYAIVRQPGLRLGLYTNAGLAVGATEVSTNPDTFDADTHMTAFDFGFGMRLRLRRFELGMGFLQRNTNYDESDVVNGMVFTEVDTEFRGVHLTMGVVW